MDNETNLPRIGADDFARRFSLRAGNLMWLLGAGASAAVGNPDFSFKWTRATVRRRNPDVIRDYYNWSLDDFLANIEAVPS